MMTTAVGAGILCDHFSSKEETVEAVS